MNKFTVLFQIAVVLLCPQVFCMEQASAEQAERESIIRRYAPIYSSLSMAFADAFIDPNIVIGLFEYPSPSLIRFADIKPNLPSEEIIEILNNFSEAMGRFGLIKLHCIKIIQGDMAGSVAYISAMPTLIEQKPHLLSFHPSPESKWILALRKTTPEYRAARFHQDMGKYKFLNDNTFFTVWGFQYGALCLEWPEDFEQPDWVVKVSEDIIDDFKVIQEIATDLQESRLDPNDAADMTKLLETEQAKSIYAELLRIKTADPQDSVDESSERK